MLRCELTEDGPHIRGSVKVSIDAANFTFIVQLPYGLYFRGQLVANKLPDKNTDIVEPEAMQKFKLGR